MSEESKRAAMNETFEVLPDWLRLPFEPFRDAVSLLLDQRKIDLAVTVVAAINAPKDFTTEQMTTFNTVKNGMASALADLHADDPLRSPEALAMILISQERRQEEAR